MGHANFFPLYFLYSVAYGPRATLQRKRSVKKFGVMRLHRFVPPHLRYQILVRLDPLGDPVGQDVREAEKAM